MASDILLDVDIVTPTSTAFSGKARAVTVPGAKSPFQILVNHAPIVSGLEIGPIKVIEDDGNITWFATDGGFVEVLKNKVTVVVETAIESSTIDTKEAEQAVEVCREKIQTASAFGISAINSARMKLRSAENKLRVALRQDESR